MRKARVINGPYIKPECYVVSIKIETNLLDGSVGGGHEGAEDDEELNSKQGCLFEE